MNYLYQLQNWLKTQSRQQQLLLAGGLGFILLLTSALIYWVVKPSYGILFNRLDNRDASQILTRLEQEGIAYQVRNHSQEILIDKNLIDKTRIKLMASGMQLSSNVGFELFDKSDFGMTDFSQKINYQRALQGELERTINSLDEVRQSRVHLVIPENHLFEQENNKPHAAVNLHLIRTISPQQVKSIQSLIAASVARLSQTDVVIVDQNGNTLTATEEDDGLNHFHAKKQLEEYLASKTMHMLNQIFTHDHAIVKIDATLNYDQFKRDLVKPQNSGIVTHEKETRHAQNAKPAKTPTTEDITREKSYQFGREKQQFIRANGTIRRLTISVVVPERCTAERIRQIERLVKSVTGFDAQRGDSITVEALLADQQPEPETTILPAITEKKSSQPAILIGVTGLFALAGAALFLRWRARMRRQQLLHELQQWLIEHG
ncbi:flagellar basal-body MS-ring/collar protein FliF [Legionella dresdenensis]|uniref:Flagellar M-ring protein n=1 Tax=Legionella dresdenensis TaxID=450200 RepID=A0ABV8CGQ1_9GAMM